jgi:hypothetical protein
MVKCMRCRIMLPESRKRKIMRSHVITPGLSRSQIQAEFKYIIANNIGKRFFGYMCDDCWVSKKRFHS